MKKIYSLVIILILSFLISSTTRAACVPAETSVDDVIVCSGTNTGMLNFLSGGNDLITLATSSSYKFLNIDTTGTTSNKIINNFGYIDMSTTTYPLYDLFHVYAGPTSSVYFNNYSQLFFSGSNFSNGYKIVSFRNDGPVENVIQNKATGNMFATSTSLDDFFTLYSSDNNAIRFVNDGLLGGIGLYNLVSVWGANGTSTFINNGNISVQDTSNIFSIQSGNMFIVNNGTIESGGSHVSASRFGIISGGGTGVLDFINNGIASTSDRYDGFYLSGAINNITNRGVLKGGIKGVGKSIENITNSATGTMTEDIYLDQGSDTVKNQGIINGTIRDYAGASRTLTVNSPKTIINRGSIFGSIYLSSLPGSFNANDSILISLDIGTTTGSIYCGGGTDSVFIEATSTTLRNYNTTQINSTCENIFFVGGGDIRLTNNTIPGNAFVTGDTLLIGSVPNTTIAGNLSLAPQVVYNNVVDNYVGNLKFNISAGSATSSTNLFVNGIADLEGRLVVATTTNTVFTLGQEIKLMDYTSLQDPFIENSFPKLSSGLGFDINYYVDHLSITVASSAVNYRLDNNAGLIYTGKFLTTISTSSASLIEGSSTSLYLSLNGTPSSPVTITCTPDSQLSVSTTTVVAVGGDIALFVKITATDHNIYEGNHTGTLSCISSSIDTSYTGQKFTITVAVTDNDTAPVVSLGGGGGSSGGGGGGSSASPVKTFVETLTKSNVNATLAVSSINTTIDSTPIEIKKIITTNILYLQKNKNTITLQKYLNSKGYIIAVKGPGSIGKESTYFGPATKKALMKYQIDNKIKPATGLFNVATKNFLKSQLDK